MHGTVVVVVKVWVQVALKSAQDQRDDVINLSSDLNDSTESNISRSTEARDTWHWWVVVIVVVVVVVVVAAAAVVVFVSVL